jgi:hypothetical protein
MPHDKRVEVAHVVSATEFQAEVGHAIGSSSFAIFFAVESRHFIVGSERKRAQGFISFR